MERCQLPTFLLLLGVAALLLLAGCGGGGGPIMVACGPGHLIQAIVDANADSDPTTLDLDAGCTYDFHNAYSPSNASNYYGRVALPPITSPVNMHGNDAVLEVFADDTRHLYISSAGNLTIEDATLLSGKTIMGNWLEDRSGGGAIHNDGGVLRATGVTFRDNHGILHGGAIHNRGSLVLDGCLFEDNEAFQGGAVYSVDTEDIPLTITDTRFESNSGAYGGALYSAGENAQVSVHDSDFERNRAEASGAAIYVHGGDLAISSSWISNNELEEPHTILFQDRITEHGSGGGIYFEGDQMTATDGHFYSNHALTYGGGIFFSGEELQCSTTEVGSSTAPLDGGGIHASGGTLDLSTCLLFQNATNGSGGGIYAEVTNAEVEASEFQYNSAGDRGGAIYMQGETLTVDLTEFFSNETGHGLPGDWSCPGDVIAGGLYSNAEAAITDSSFYYNQTRHPEYCTALGLGGAIYNDDKMTVDGCTLGTNLSRRGAGLYNAGRLWVVNSTFYDNAGEEYGGGLYNTDSASIKFTTIYSNSVSNTLGISGLVGAGIYNGSGETFVRNSIVSENVSGGTTPDNCAAGSGEVISFGGTRGGNLESMLSAQPDGWETCQYFSHVAGDTMGPFDDHGGPTGTVSLIPGQSAAIDAAWDCEIFGQWVGVDQRDVTRPHTECDAGAYEYMQDPDAPPPPEPPPIEPSPSATVTPSPTPEEKICRYTALENLNCRESDYKDSKQIAILMQGEMATLIALNPSYTHGKFETPDGKVCWMWFGMLEGPENPVEVCDVPIVVAPTPPPTEPPPPECSPDLDAEQCEESGGTWESGGAAEPECSCP